MADELSYKEAWDLAHMKAPESNLARCYISAIQALMRVKTQTLSASEPRLIIYTCESVIDEIEKSP